jgi:hypothetical protein
VIAPAADESRPRDQQAIPHHGGGGSLARDFRLAVLLTLGNVLVRRGQDLRGLVGPGDGVGSIDVA